MPGAGGEYLFLSRIFHPIFGFLSGWVSFIVGFSAPIAASAMGFSEYFCRAVPGFPEWISSAGIMNEAWTKKIISVGVISDFHINTLPGNKDRRQDSESPYNS